MFRAFCAVAPVPRPEDVGIDLIATLLSREDEYLYAGGTFYTQIKSGKRRTHIEFTAENYRWFRRLELPYFIAWVDLDANRMDVFGTHVARWHLNYPDFTDLILRFTPRTRRTKSPNKPSDIYLGDPILSLHIDDLRKGFDQEASNIMSSWLALERIYYATRAFSACGGYSWETNQIPKVDDAITFLGRGVLDDTEIDAAIDGALPSVVEIVFAIQRSNPELSRQLAAIIDQIFKARRWPIYKDSPVFNKMWPVIEIAFRWNLDGT